MDGGRRRTNMPLRSRGSSEALAYEAAISRTWRRFRSFNQISRFMQQWEDRVDLYTRILILLPWRISSNMIFFRMRFTGSSYRRSEQR